MKSSWEIEIRPSSIRSLIAVGEGLLDSGSVAQECRALTKEWAVICDGDVAALYEERLCCSLEDWGIKPLFLTFPEGEGSKSRAVKEELEEQMLEHRLGRDAGVLACGGGVATDLGAFIAATYCRGIPYIALPTTLLGMVDAALGGKCGVNTPHGKNLIGALWPAKGLFCDLSLLKTLPKRHLRAGCAEMIKHGAIADGGYFHLLSKRREALLQGNIEALHEAIVRSLEIKTLHVVADLRDGGLRHMLNFGHTVGHALETLFGYTLLHGEAVAIGMVAEAHLAHRLGILAIGEVEELTSLIALFGLPVEPAERVDLEALFEVMSRDKKAQNSQPRCALIEAIGRGASYGGPYRVPVERNLVINLLKELWKC